MYMANGFWAYYDTNASGVESLNGFDYYNDFKLEADMSGSEENLSISGTMGTTCLGGTMTFATNPVVQQNQDDYFDGDDSHGSNVLPYTGVFSVSGGGHSATVTFEHNASNYTTATIAAPDGNATYDRWSDLAVGACD